MKDTKLRVVEGFLGEEGVAMKDPGWGRQKALVYTSLFVICAYA